MAAPSYVRAALILAVASLCPAALAFSPKLDAPIRTVLAVGPEGLGNGAAGEAVKSLSAGSGADLPEILAAMDGANDYALNWLRAAIEVIAQREMAAGKRLPAAELETFLNDKKHHPRARRLAYELIGRVDAGRAHQMLPGFVNDPSPELRYEAVQRLVDRAADSVAAISTGWWP